MEAFQVFLSYKHSGENGEKTPDAQMAEELYAELTKRGIKTFYSSRSIRKLGEGKYKVAIDDALDEASVLVAVGTSAENLNSNWVKYEWDSFHGDILSGRKEGQLISFIADMRQFDLPRTLRQMESFEKGKNTVEEICDFICTYLGANKKKGMCPADCRVISLREYLSHGFTALDAENAFSENDKLLYEDMPAEVAGTSEQWAEIIQKYPDCSAVVVDDEFNIYGNYTVVGLTADEEAQMAKGTLKDAGLSADTAENIYMPGFHVGYLLNLSVNPSSESASVYKTLWDHFIDTLKRFAKEERVFFSKIYYKAFLPEHEARVMARGFRYCCKDKYYGNVYVHDMDPGSTLFALDQELAEIYSKAVSHRKLKIRNEKQLQELDALTAYMDLWKQIENLFYLPEYCRLKKYFMGGKGIPQNSMEYKMGLAVSEWIRDNLQYSESLLPFIPEEQQEAHRLFKEKIYSSEIVKDSIKQYQFATENDEHHEADTAETSAFSVKALITFANIWLDIDRLFMTPELLDYKQFFYENRDMLPCDEDLEICEMIAVRILSVFRISEDQLKQLPIEYVESYYNYKDMICSSALAQQVLAKAPFLRREIYNKR